MFSATARPPVSHGLREWRPLNGRPGLRMAVWLQVQSPMAACLAYSLHKLCLWHNSATVYECFAFAFLHTHA